MLENAAKADEIIGRIAEQGREAAERGEVRGGGGPEGWSRLGKTLRELAQASPSACERLAMAWEACAAPSRSSFGGDVASDAAAQAHLAADYARHEAAPARPMSGYGACYGYSLSSPARSSWLPDCQAVCEVTQEYDDEGGTQECASIRFEDKSGKIHEGRDAKLRCALDQLAHGGLRARYERSWSAQEVYESAHESFGVGSWGDMAPLARAAEAAKAVFEERTLSSQTPKAPRKSKARM